MTGLLYNRSCYSLLSSTITIDKLVSFAVEQGYEAIALTDQNVLFGAMEFYHKCTARNIKPVFGLEVQAYDSLDSYTYLLYARNEAGYQELIKISSRLNCGSNEQLSVAEVLAFKNVIIVENALNVVNLQSMILISVYMLCTIAILLIVLAVAMVSNKDI